MLSATEYSYYLPQVLAAEDQFSFKQKSSKHLQEFVNGQVSQKCCKTHLRCTITLSQSTVFYITI